MDLADAEADSAGVGQFAGDHELQFKIVEVLGPELSGPPQPGIFDNELRKVFGGKDRFSGLVRAQADVLFELDFRKPIVRKLLGIP